MAKKTTGRMKAAAAAFPVPQMADEASALIAEIGCAQRERDRIRAAMNDEMAALKERHEAAARPFKERIEALSKGVQAYCEAHRAELTSRGKSHRFAAGEVQWRRRPPKVSIRGADKVLERLKGLRLSRFIRVKEEIDKEAMLKDPDTADSVDGVSITQGEDFVIKPFETALEEVAK